VRQGLKTGGQVKAVHINQVNTNVNKSVLMKTKIIFSVMAFAIMANAYSQNSTIQLTFTANNNGTNVQLDSIKVMNRTQGGDYMLYWPDTTLTYEITPGDLLLYLGYWNGYPVGLQETHPKTGEFTLFQNYPNPVKDQSIITMFIPEKETVNTMVTDETGRSIISNEKNLDKGYHSFRFSPGNGHLFFLTVRSNGISHTIKILSTDPDADAECRLDYIGNSNHDALLKSSANTMGKPMEESGILDSPVGNKTYTFEFATNIPCPGTPTVTYEGQVYNTIQIFSQCWLKENLNVGTMIPGTQGMSNNNVIEKYCYNNDISNCNIYGGLYQWNEMMQYNSQQGVQGICPSGWHLPTDEEWKVLEGAVDSQYGIGYPMWDNESFRGDDAGTNLRTTDGWNGGGNGTDLFGFSGLPGGDRLLTGGFGFIGNNGLWWASTERWSFQYGWWGWFRDLDYNNPEVSRTNYKVALGHSVRCLRDN
jgi:uncharacterized protein (TIGR02145 family)